MESRMGDYEIMEQIGRGAFGAAILVNHKLERKKYVLKKIRLARQTERCRKSAHQEMVLIARLQHPYIVEFKEAWVEKGCYVCIVAGYCEGGDMAEVMRKANGQYFPEEKLLKWFTQLLLAVEYLHSNFVLHRDLKCSNIFLTKDQDVRLGDFGLAKTLKADDLTSSVVGTPNYMCPELFADIPYGFKSDIWSLGCCMYEMAAHHHAFKALDMASLVSKINRSSMGPLPQCYSPSLTTLIKSMLRKSPENRPTASELLKHKLLQPYVDQYPASSAPISTTSDRRNSTSSSCSDKGDLVVLDDTIIKCSHKATDGHRNENKSKQPRIIQNIITALKEKHASPIRVQVGIKNNTETFNSLKHQLPIMKTQPKKTPLGQSGCSDVEDPCSSYSHFPMEEIMQKSVAVAVASKRMQTESSSERSDDLKARLTSSLQPMLETREQVEIIKSPSSPLDMVQNHQPIACAIETIQYYSDDKTTNEDMSSTISTDRESVATHDSSSKEVLDVKSFRQRAEALEGLLELSAELLQQNRLQQLSVILKPFGKEKVSSRDTAIWLAKSLKEMIMLQGYHE